MPRLYTTDFISTCTRVVPVRELFEALCYQASTRGLRPSLRAEIVAAFIALGVTADAAQRLQAAIP